MPPQIFQTNFAQFVLPLLVVAVQAAVDVVILDKNDYPGNSFTFTLELLECVSAKRNLFVAVQATVVMEDECAKISWPNYVEKSIQDTASDSIAPDVERSTGPDYTSAYFVLATDPDIDGRRSYIMLPETASLTQGSEIEISFGLGSLNKDDQDILKEIYTFQISLKDTQNVMTAPIPQLGDKINEGAFGEIYSVTYLDGPLTEEDLVMKTCPANKAGTVVPFEDWAEIDFDENINRNDYRIGRLLNPYNEDANTVGPKYYTEGTIEIKGKHCYYFIMGKVKGTSLEEDFIEAYMALSSHGDCSKLVKFLLAVLSAIIRLHKTGVLHRDTHFGNFMKLDGSKEFITIDFGLSRIAVEWENHIIKKRPISAKQKGVYSSLRMDFGLGTHFYDDLDIFVFKTLDTFTATSTFGDPDRNDIQDNKIKALVSNWLECPDVPYKFKNADDYIVKNLNDMLFLSPTLVHCRNVYNQKLDHNQLKLSLQQENGKLFSKNDGQQYENEVLPSGFLPQGTLPFVEERYIWPEYEKYKTALSNIATSTGGKRHPRDNRLHIR